MRQRSTSLAALPQSSGFLQSFSLASAHRFLVNSVLKRVTNTQAAVLRRRTAQQLFTGHSTPFLALVGVSLASGTGLITKEDEIECVCSEIRQAAAKMQTSSKPSAQAEDPTKIEVGPDEPMGSWLSRYEMGPIIAKGCNAVVFAAKVASAWSNQFQSAGEATQAPEEAVVERLLSPSIQPQPEPVDEEQEFPLAIKMMFNYEAESNAMAVISAMKRETVPTGNIRVPKQFEDWLGSVLSETKTLPPHPNIVEMHSAFADYVPNVKEAYKLFPDALPRRLNPEGLGRNMSLFLVMKRYNMSLKEFLADHGTDISWKTSLLILAQILEGITHMVNQGVAHRDLKSDNILLDLSGGIEFPVVIITDFGCCYADPKHGLKMPYSSHETNRGGNMILMAPEVVTAQPGPFTSIDYSKADVWAAGAIAYEIFGLRNPFYHDQRDASGGEALTNLKYRSKDLPALPEKVPPVVSNLVFDLLRRQPKHRLSPELAATISQLIIWAPSTWSQSNGRVPSSQEVLQWLLTLTTKIFCESRFSNDGKALREYQVVSTFLARISVPRIKEAIQWIKQNAS